MKTIEKVLNYNNRVNWNMKHKGSNALPYKKGYVVSEGTTSMYCKTIEQAKAEQVKVWEKSDSFYVAPSEREYDWGIEMSYRLTGKGSEQVSLTK